MWDQALRKLELLGLTPDETKYFETISSRVLQARRQDDLFKDGECPREVSLLLQGFACQYKLLEGGKRQITRLLVPGDFCNIQNVLFERLDYSVGALTDSGFAMIPCQRLRDWAARSPRIAGALWSESLVEVAAYREQMADIGRRSSYERVSHLICELITRLNAVGLVQGGKCAFPITQASLADALGLSSVHVNRVLRQMRDENLVTLEANALVVHDWKKMKGVSGFDDSYLYLSEPRVVHDFDQVDHKKREPSTR
jgi:CRP-like cAMP-binding protein